MMGYNHCTFVGNLTRAPELRYTPSGTAVVNFSLAVNRKFRQGDELKEEVMYLDVVVFGKRAESCGQYLDKGKGVLASGHLQQRRWEADDGQKRSKHELVAEQVVFLGAPSTGGSRRSHDDDVDYGDPSPY